MPLIFLVWVVLGWLQIVAAHTGGGEGFFNGLLVTAVLPQGDDAKTLGMPQNRPVLRVKSVNVDDRDGTPVEYAITRFRADRIQLRINP